MVSTTGTPEGAGWASMGDNTTTQPQPTVAQHPATSSTTAVTQPTQTGPASRQIQRIKACQQLLPVDDHGNYDNDYDHNHNHDHDKADDKQAVDLERVHQGKRQQQPITCPPWNNEFCLLQVVQELKEVSMLEANAHITAIVIIAQAVGQTPVYTNIVILLLRGISQNQIDFDSMTWYSGKQHQQCQWTCHPQWFVI